jgi:hypothetical protein
MPASEECVGKAVEKSGPSVSGYLTPKYLMLSNAVAATIEEPEFKIEFVALLLSKCVLWSPLSDHKCWKRCWEICQWALGIWVYNTKTKDEQRLKNLNSKWSLHCRDASVVIVSMICGKATQGE